MRNVDGHSSKAIEFCSHRQYAQESYMRDFSGVALKNNKM